MKWTKPGEEFDSLSKIICDPGNQYYLWGAGVFGKSTYEQLNGEISISGFIDSDPMKQGQHFCGLPVFAPTVLHQKQQQIKIIVTTGWTQQVFAELHRMGYQLNVDYFSNETFATVYFMYAHQHLYLPRLDLMITTKCTLQCKHCGMSIPYYPEKGHMSFSEIQKELTNFFAYVDSLGVLGISGGDAFLHPHLEEIIEYIGTHYYGNQIRTIEIYTNAILLPPPSLLRLLQKYHVILRFTDYSKRLPGRQKIDAFLGLCAEYGIEVEHVKLDMWFDYGLREPLCRKDSAADITSHFDRCASQCRGLFQSRLYFCAVACSAARAGLLPDFQENYFELVPYAPEKKRLLMEFNIGYSRLGYLPACAYCKGNQNVNTCFVAVGEQLCEECQG